MAIAVSSVRPYLVELKPTFKPTVFVPGISFTFSPLPFGLRRRLLEAAIVIAELSRKWSRRRIRPRIIFH